MSKVESKVGLWTPYYKDVNVRKMYDDETTAIMASKWLNQSDIVTIEDWGCGFGGFKNYISSHQTYIGLDGTQNMFTDKIVDLVLYTSSVDAIHMRAIIEHNEDWKPILNNFLSSFTKRAVLTLFTPFTEQTKIIQTYENWKNTGKTMVDISFSFDELMSIIGQYPEIKVSSELNLKTNTQYNVEHVFYLEKA